MEVILLNDVDKVGLRGEVVNVTRGYARNFLLPRRLAEAATPEKVAELRKREGVRARHEAASVEQAEEVLKKVNHRVWEKASLSGDPTGDPIHRHRGWSVRRQSLSNRSGTWSNIDVSSCYR